jgi:hypothetical protein
VLVVVVDEVAEVDRVDEYEAQVRPGIARRAPRRVTLSERLAPLYRVSLEVSEDFVGDASGMLLREPAPRIQLEHSRRQ